MFHEAIINRCEAYYRLGKTGIGGYAKIDNNEVIEIIIANIAFVVNVTRVINEAIHIIQIFALFHISQRRFNSQFASII
jgi:hypothetical protein